MAKDADEVRLGSGDLYIDNVDVGHLSGEVVLTITRGGAQLSPFGSGSTAIRTLEEAKLRATVAQLNAANLRLALGLTGSAATSTGPPAYNPASVSVAAAQSWTGINIGRTPLTSTTVAIRFEHTKEEDGDKRIVLVLYSAVCPTRLTLPFAGDRVTMHNLEFTGLADESRAAGDQIGMILEEE